MTKLHRRFSPRTFALVAIGLTVISCIYYAGYTVNSEREKLANGIKISDKQDETNTNWRQNHQHLLQIVEQQSSPNDNSHIVDMCPKITPSDADINTVDVFKGFDFQPNWMEHKEYWDKSFEERYEQQKMNAERPPLKVIIVPHSHNDPGWLKTFEQYFSNPSRQIMQNMVTKLHQYTNLTFIWSEISFLNAWWEEVHPSKHRALRQLVQSKRLEITTGGWVMTDEANSHIYAMVDQLIEGHQWLWRNLGIEPRTGWSVDPFGHGSTQPYLLASAGIQGTVIQRIHYAWKQWLAEKQFGDFRWTPAWTSSTPPLLTHNQPFDIYSIKHSCGPHPSICLNFDFRKVAGEYTEYSTKAQVINKNNIEEKSKLLLEQYAKTGSLLPHNVVLVPLGDDFRYNEIEEWDQQYVNYMKLINYINQHKDDFKAEITFGTPSDYFDEILKRFNNYPSLKGDFFVYSDIFAEGRPAYWSGYFTTRPFMKILDRELEHNLRSAEILYAIAVNYARNNKLLPHTKVLERDFEKLVKARRNLALFQHHDAITGTSKAFVMRDYGQKLFQGIRDSTSIQQNSLTTLLWPKINFKPDSTLLLSDLERDTFDKVPKKTTIIVNPHHPNRTFVVFNSLAQDQEHYIRIRTNTWKVKITDENGSEINYQINPVWENISETTSSKLNLSLSEFEVVFIAKLKPLSVTVFNVSYTDGSRNKLATIYCNNCENAPGNITASEFPLKIIPVGDIQLENHKFRLLFSGQTGFLRTITRLSSRKLMQCGINFAAYRSAQFHSGAYLFKPDPNERDFEKDVLQQYRDDMTLLITSGPVSSELTVIYAPFLLHTVRLFHITNSVLSEAIGLETIVDFELPPKNRETELFMRIVSDVQNGEPPEFYSDLNGFQMQKRVKIERIGIEGNYYPMTTMAYIQDTGIRLSLLTNHAQGVSSWQPGFLEVMLDRRTLYDDGRGMGEGLVDNKRTVNTFWLLIEDVASENVKNEVQQQQQRFDDSDDALRSFNIGTEDTTQSLLKSDELSVPSLYANQMSNALNYPAAVFIVEQSDGMMYGLGSRQLINAEFPCDVHLMNLRMQPDPVYSQFPSSSALMVVHRQGYDCAVNGNVTCRVSKFPNDIDFEFVTVNSIQAKALTGVTNLLDVQVQRLRDISIDPLSIKTFNLTFV